MDKTKQWKKVEDKIFKFEKKGDSVEGKLVSIEDSMTYKNKVYKIKNDNDENIVVFGTSVLDSQLSSIEINTMVKIVFTGTKESKTKGYKPIQMFEVFTA